MIIKGAKFFERNKCLSQDGSTSVASSGDSSSARALDRNPVTYWRTVGSTDASTETLTVTFSQAETFSRIFLVDHNFKYYTIKYDVAGVWTDFTSVMHLDGSSSNISESSYSKDTSYYEFNSVTSTAIQISVTTTQVVNAQKYLAQLIVTNELGTLEGYPQIKNTELSRQLRSETMLSGRALTVKSDDVFKVAFDFKSYPASLASDLDLAFRLHDTEQSFLIWICGGAYGSDRFKYQMRGYRLRDVYPVQMTSPVKPIYSDNVYQNTVNFSLAFQEATD